MISLRSIGAAACFALGLVGSIAGSIAGCAQETPAPQETPALTRAPRAVHVRIAGPLEVSNMALLERALRTARAGGQELIVIEIDTPGGEINLSVMMARQIVAAADDGVRTVAWVNRAASSAGALITLACERIHMSSSATIGAALPVTMSPTGMVAVEGDVGEKWRSYLRSEFRAHAETHGRSTVLAESMVDPEIEAREVIQDGERRVISGSEWDDLTERGEQPELVRTLVRVGELLSLTTNEAIALGIADGRADDLAEVLSREGFDGATAISVTMSRSESLLAKLAMITPALLALGLMLGYVEFKTPGFGIAGILGLICLGLALTGRYMTGLAEVPHLVMVFVGAVLICVELFVVPGTIWVGLMGAVVVMGGLWLSEFGPGFSFLNPYDQSRALDAAFELGMIALASMIGIWILSHFLPDTPVLRAMVQAPIADGTGGFAGALPEAQDEDRRVARPGALGVAVTDLRPVGKVTLDDAPAIEFEASADGPALATGARVRVVAVQAGRLVVGPEEQDQQDADPETNA